MTAFKQSSGENLRRNLTAVDSMRDRKCPTLGLAVPN